MATRSGCVVLSADFDAPRQGLDRIVSYLCAAGQTFYKGAMVMIKSDGLAYPVPVADDSTDLSAVSVVGRCEKYIASAAATDVVPVSCDGVYRYLNLAGDPVVQADVNTVVFAASDNQILTTQVASSGKAPPAGVCINFDSTYVWVLIGPGVRRS